MLVCPKEDKRPCCSTHSEKHVLRGPCHPTRLSLETGHMTEKERELLHSSWKAILPGVGMDQKGKCTTANPHILAFHKELESTGLEMERAAAYLRWTMTVCEERCSSLDMLLWKKNIKPIKMTNIASIFPSPSVERPVITHLWVSTLLALCSYPWLPVGKRDIFFISDSYYIL